MFYTFIDKADHQGLSEFLSFTNGELQSSRLKVISPETRVMSPEIYSHVVRYFESCCPKFDNAEKDSGCSFRCCFHGDSKPKIKYEIKKTTVCSNISYSMVLTVVFICWSILFWKRSTSLLLERWKRPPSWLQHVLKNHHMIAKHDCDVAINSAALIQTYLLLAIDLLTSQAFEREVRLYKRERASWVLLHQTRKPCERLWESLC